MISGIFFGGNPRVIIEAVVDGNIDAFATVEIIEEYTEIIERIACVVSVRRSERFYTIPFAPNKPLK